MFQVFCCWMMSVFCYSNNCHDCSLNGETCWHTFDTAHTLLETRGFINTDEMCGLINFKFIDTDDYDPDAAYEEFLEHQYQGCDAEEARAFGQYQDM